MFGGSGVWLTVGRNRNEASGICQSGWSRGQCGVGNAESFKTRRVIMRNFLVWLGCLVLGVLLGFWIVAFGTELALKVLP